jgi:hypothetical protein
MSRFDQVPDVPVIIGPCLCPGEPHDGGDIVYLHPVLSAPGGMAAQGAIADSANDAVKLQELLWRVYRDHGISSWNLVDDDGDPVPLTPANIEVALPYGKGGRLVGDKADDLYSEDILVPFLARMRRLEQLAAEAKRKPSAAGSTRNSRKATSKTPTSTKRRPSRSSTPATAEAPPAA